MKLRISGIASICFGVVLLVGSFVWSHAIPQRVLWSDEQAVQYQDVAAEYHNVAFSKDKASQEYQDAREAYESRLGELDRALEMRDRPPILLRMCGLIAGGVGLALIFVHRVRTHS